MKQEMMGWQLHQLDHMQIICTSIQTDNHTSTSPLITEKLSLLISIAIHAVYYKLIILNYKNH